MTAFNDFVEVFKSRDQLYKCELSWWLEVLKSPQKKPGAKRGLQCGGDLNNVQCKTIWTCHNESPHTTNIS
jgi:hypothetical protein